MRLMCIQLASKLKTTLCSFSHDWLLLWDSLSLNFEASGSQVKVVA